MKEPRRPRAGDLVQLWDTSSPIEHEAKITDHGKHGYIIRESKQSDTFLDGKGDTKYLSRIVEGDVFKIILFEGDASNVIHVHQDNIRRIENV